MRAAPVNSSRRYSGAPSAFSGNVRPLWQTSRMAEFTVSASDFRSHLSRIASCVAFREDRCLISRHGHDLVALVSWEDLQFLRKHRPVPSLGGAAELPLPIAAHFAPRPHPPGAHEERLPDPQSMSLVEVQALYDQLKNRWHSMAVSDWVVRAARLLGSSAGATQPASAAPPS